jgi:hypothetical protein
MEELRLRRETRLIPSFPQPKITMNSNFLVRVLVFAAVLLGSAGSASASLVSIQSYNGQWLCAEGGGGQAVLANRPAVDIWERFSLTDWNGGNLQSGDEITLQAYNGQYFCAEAAGSQPLVANRGGVGGWEVFRIHKPGGGTIGNGDQVYFQACNDQYWHAENGGGSTIIADRSSPDAHETFTITIGGAGLPYVNTTVSSISVHAGQTVTFSVSASCNDGLNELGLNACDVYGNAVTTLASSSIGGATSASRVFSWTPSASGTYFFNTYAYNADRSQLSLTPLVAVTVADPNNSPSEWVDVDNDGILDEIVPGNSLGLVYSITQWYTTSSYWDYPINNYWGGWDSYWPGYTYSENWQLNDAPYYSNWNWVWEFESYFWTSSYSYFDVSFTFQTDADRRTGIYRDRSGSHEINPNNWEDIFGTLVFGTTGDRTISTTFYDGFDLQAVQFYVVKFGRAGDTVPPQKDFNWEWEQIPGFPTGEWDGVTIGPNFPKWNWEGWMNDTWFMPLKSDVPFRFQQDGEYQDVERLRRAEELRKIQKMQKAIKWVRLISRATIIGIAAGELVDVWINKEMERRKNEAVWSFVVYEKYHPSGFVYTGQAYGLGTAEQVRARRDATHYEKNAAGYAASELVAYMTTTGLSVHAWAAMGGYEQQVMDYHGGAISDRGNPGMNGRTRASNDIRFYSRDDVTGMTFWLTSQWAYGFLHGYDGNRTTGFVVPEDRLILIKWQRFPYFYPY